MAQTNDNDGRLLAGLGRRFEPGEVLYETGERATLAFLLEEGRVRIFRRSGHQTDAIRDVHPGDLFGECALIAGSVRTSTAVAITEGLALAVDASTFEQVMQNPKIPMRILRQLVRRVVDLEERTAEAPREDDSPRVVGGLVDLASEVSRDQIDPGRNVLLRISPIELAERVGVDVESVRRVVQRLRTEGVVRIRNERVEVPSLAALENASASLTPAGVTRR